MNYNPFTLEGKTILVTGASSGIGRATAVECSKMGATVVLTARNEERLQETLSMMEGEGHTVISADLTDEEDITRLVGVLPMLDGVAYIAGAVNVKCLKYFSPKSVQSLFDVNTFSSVYLTRSLIKSKKINMKASLVFLSSISSSLNPCSGNGIYSMTKAAIEAFSRQCAIELKDKEIRSNAILPGMVDTELITAFDYYREYDEKYYIGGHYGNPKDVALMVVYLMSNASTFITGSSIVMDGGRSLSHD